MLSLMSRLRAYPIALDIGPEPISDKQDRRCLSLLANSQFACLLIDYHRVFVHLQTPEDDRRLYLEFPVTSYRIALPLLAHTPCMQIELVISSLC